MRSGIIVSCIVARRLYVPDRGNKEKATFPSGQVTSDDVSSAGNDKDIGESEAAEADDVNTVDTTVDVI